MRKLPILATAALLTTGSVGTANAQYRYGRGWGCYGGYYHNHYGWGGGALAAGLIGGAILGGLLTATAYPAYGYPVYGYYAPHPIYYAPPYYYRPHFHPYYRRPVYLGRPRAIYHGYYGGPHAHHVVHR